MIKYVTYSLSGVVFRNVIKTKQAFGVRPTNRQIFATLGDSKQDFKVLQDVAQATKQSFNVTQGVAQDVLSRQRTSPKLRTVQKQKQKKKPKLRISKPKNIRTLSKKVMTYGIVVRSGGKAIKLKVPAMTLLSAYDFASNRIDKRLIRTAKIVPLGMTNKVAILPKSVRGYYKAKRKKFRTFQVKKGKKLSLTRTIIENKKYIGDTVSERRELSVARAKARKSVKRRPTKKVIKKRVLKRTHKKKVIKKSQKKQNPRKVKRKIPVKTASRKRKKSPKKKKVVKKRRKKKSPTFPSF